MIVVDEPLATARDIPFHLPLAADPLTGLTGHVFIVGEVQYRLPGGAYMDADPTPGVAIFEVGFGDYVLRLTQAETATPGFVYIYANVPTAQVWSSTEQIGTQGGGILIGETDDAKREVAFHIPDATNPLNPITGHSFIAGEVQIALPGGTYAIADETRVVEKGFGDYALRLTDAQVAARGKVFLHVDIGPTGQPWSAYYDIVEPAGGLSGEAVTIANIEPPPDEEVLPSTPISFEVTSGTGDPIIIPRIILDPFAESEPVWDVVNGVFEPKYAEGSTREVISGGYRFIIRRKGGWYAMPRLVVENASGDVIY